MKYRLEEIKPAPQTLADVPEGEPVDCEYSGYVEKLVRIGGVAFGVRHDGTAGITIGAFASCVNLWRPTAKPLPTTMDQLGPRMVAVDNHGNSWHGPTSKPYPIASPIYRVVEVK